MKLYDLLQNSNDEITVWDRDYDVEMYFYGTHYGGTSNDNWDKSMAELSKRLDVVVFSTHGVTVNMSELIEKNLENIKKTDLFISNDIDDIMEDMPNIIAGHVSEKWLEKFVSALKEPQDITEETEESAEGLTTMEKGVSFCTVLTIVFIVLKLCHVIEWSWLWVLAPLWIPLIILIVAFVILLIVD